MKVTNNMGDTPQETTPSTSTAPSSVSPTEPSTTISTSEDTDAPMEEPEVKAGTSDQDSAKSMELGEDVEPDFPHAELAKLDEMINRPRWVVPVLPNGELEVLLDAAINLCKKNLDTRSEACQRFFRDGLTISFTKILTDEAVNGWKYEIHVRFIIIGDSLIYLFFCLFFAAMYL